MAWNFLETSTHCLGSGSFVIVWRRLPCLYFSLQAYHSCWLNIPFFSDVLPFYFPSSCGKSAFGGVKLWSAAHSQGVQSPVLSIPAPTFPGGFPSCHEGFSWPKLLQQSQGLFLQEIQGKGISMVGEDQVSGMFQVAASLAMASVVRQK